MLLNKEKVMHKFFRASSWIAALIMMAGCAANQGGSFVPTSLVPTGDRAVAAADGGHRDGPDTGSSIVEFKIFETGFDFITPDFAGHEWFGLVNPVALAAMDEHTGSVVQQYNLPASYSGPFDLAMNPARNVLWFTEPGTNAIGYLNLLNQTIGQFTVPTHNSYPEGITAGPGNDMWFTEAASGKIGKINTVTHAFTEYSVSSSSKPYRITLGPDGALWFTNQGYPSSIGRVTTHGHVHLYAIGLNTPTGITTGPDGGIWFTGKSDHDGGLLGRIDPNTHVRKLYKYASGDGGNGDLTVRDSDFWMTRTQGNRIDRFDHTTHIIYSRSLPHGYTRPLGIALGADDQLWFMNVGQQTTAVGKLCPSLTQGQCKGAF
jgi:virginiamycin B lyase